MSDLPSSFPWKVQLLSALIRQGPSFVVLLLLLVGLGQFGNFVVTQGIPAHLAAIQEGYVQIQSHHDRNLERVARSFDEEQERYRALVGIVDHMIQNKAILLENKSLLEKLSAGATRATQRPPAAKGEP